MFAPILDPDLRNYIESSTVFKSVSETIKNEILNCVFQIDQNEIKKHIEEAVMANNVSEQTQMITFFSAYIYIYI